MKILLAIALVPLLLLALPGCVTSEQVFRVPVSQMASHPPQDYPEEAPPTSQAGVASDGRPAGMERLPSLSRSVPGLAQDDWSERFPADDQVRVAVEDMPLGQFIHYAFGELLAVSYVIADGLQNLEGPVTLNLQEPVSSRRLYGLAAELLAGRDIGITARDGVFYIHPVDRRAKGNVFIGMGRRVQDVPEVPGPVMQIIPLRYGVTLSIERTIRDLVDARVVADAQQGALFVTGERAEVLRVLDIVNLLDQPAYRGRFIGLAPLTFIGAEEFMTSVVELLEAEGVQAGVGRAEGKSVALVALEAVGAVAVFTSTQQLLDRIDFWARQLDRPSQGAEQRYFIYSPRYSRADELGEALAPLLGESFFSGQADPGEARDTRSALSDLESPRAAARDAVDSALRNRRDNSSMPMGGGTRQAVAVRGEGLTMAVDVRSNALIFFTSGARYQALLPMIRRLDSPPRQILLEAMIAEVTLTDEFAMGVEFAVTSGNFRVGTTGGLGLPDGGGFLAYIGGDSVARAQLSASNRLVNVLSNPSLVVRDGVSANISVGNDIPTIGATFFDPIESSGQVTSIQYRKTGVNLTVRPMLNAQGLVVMEIQQNISNVADGGSEVEGAPAIFERALTTEVVARSGQTIMLGGLISENKSTTVAKVPGLGDIPVIGRLFRSDRESTTRTELVVLITPRVIDESNRWENVRYRLENSLRNLKLDGWEPPDAIPPAINDSDSERPSQNF
jgi:general secretion pathway protein D